MASQKEAVIAPYRAASSSAADRETSRLAAHRNKAARLEYQNVRELTGPLRTGTVRGPLSLMPPGAPHLEFRRRQCGQEQPGGWLLGPAIGSSEPAGPPASVQEQAAKAQQQQI